MKRAAIIIKDALPVLTLKQPWASWVISGRWGTRWRFTGFKDIENRGRPWKYRGPFVIHAGLSRDRAVGLTDQPVGVILGVVDIVDCVSSSKSPWFSGPYGYVLERPRALKLPYPEIAGKRGIWYLPPKIERDIRRELKLP